MIDFPDDSTELTNEPYNGQRTVYGTKEDQSPAVVAHFQMRIKKNSDGTFSEGGPKKNLFNLILLLRMDPWWAGCIGFNELSRTISLRDDVASPWRELSDTDITRIRTWVSGVYGMDFTKDDTFSAIETVAKENSFHPVKAYLESNLWDGTPRIETWLTDYCGVEDTPLTREYGKLWLIAGVLRILRPGSKFDCCLVLKGGQGKGKTTCAQMLSRMPGYGDRCPDDAFHQLSADVSDKDTLMEISSSWIIELGELDTLRKSEATAIKNFLSKTKDKFRAPYEKVARTVLRQCVFIGTTNESRILADQTGSRRWWIVEFGALDFAGFSAIVDQLWAEAYFHAAAGVLPMLSSEMELEREEASVDYQMVDPWLEMVLKKYESEPDLSLTAGEILSEIVQMPRGQQTTHSVTRLKRTLLTSGMFKEKRIGSDGNRRTVFLLVRD